MPMSDEAKPSEESFAPPPAKRGSANEGAFLVFDIEAIPDGELVKKVRYFGEKLTPEEAIARAQDEERLKSATGSDFLPPTLQRPISICVLRVGADLLPRSIGILEDVPGDPGALIAKFWQALKHYKNADLVTFNGRGYDVPLLELGAFALGISVPGHFEKSRKRYITYHIDLMDWFSNFRAFNLIGGLNLLAKKLGLPGKFDLTGAKVYEMYQQGRQNEINEYCLCDTLDTYFIFLRSRVMQGFITLEEEGQIRTEAIRWLQAQAARHPVILTWFSHWENPPDLT
jgi:predicted PolB exonuclease-like 3'-5' exonuclease